MSIATQEHPEATAPALAFVALLVGNAALAAGPWFVRVADSGPVAAGFWRLAIALPILATLAWHERRGEQAALPRGLVWLVVAAGVFFAFDLASWHVGIEQTRLANATLFGNSGSLLIMGWGLVLLRRWPTAKEGIAVIGALAGAAILLSRSLEIDPRFFVGDLLCILAGLLYTFYILFAQRARDAIGNWTLLAIASAAGAPVLLGAALLLGEPVWPNDWWPNIGLALSSQLLGQGCLVYALRFFPPLIIGMALLTQPAIAAGIGWFAFGEAIMPLDALGMALVGGALVLARSSRAGDPARLAERR
jgi:drug/metabolite transporter (DMT)-like permease